MRNWEQGGGIGILFEDERVVVIDKPSGIVANRAETVKEATLQDWMENRYKPIWRELEQRKANLDEADKYFLERLGMVHRLDKETSGVMVFAKKSEAFVELLRLFKERAVKKEYLALTHGIWKIKDGEIVAPVGRSRVDRRRMGVREDGRTSATRYHVLQEYTGWMFPRDMKIDERGYAGFSLVRFTPLTGRTHQIRVHAKHVGHPLVGDMIYAGRKRSRADRLWAGRVMLQAQTLEFGQEKYESRQDFLAGIGEYLKDAK